MSGKMIDNDISKIKIEVMAEMAKSFYVDFMPLIKEVQKGISALKVVKEDKIVINRINENLSRAEDILSTLKNISDKAGENND